jgi:hypothetical protein
MSLSIIASCCGLIKCDLLSRCFQGAQGINNNENNEKGITPWLRRSDLGVGGVAEERGGIGVDFLLERVNDVLPIGIMAVPPFGI